MSNMDKQELDIISYKLHNHGVIAFPTETVFGLGIAFNDEEAYKRMSFIKRRPENKPYTLMLSKVEDIEKYAYLNDTSRKIIKKFMPGAVTVLLKVKDNVPAHVTLNTGVIGIRVPDFDIPLEIINRVGFPLLVPSANRSGEKPCMSSLECEETFHGELDYIVKGKALGGVPSTIIDLTQEGFKIIREGPIKEKDILEALEER